MTKLEIKAMILSEQVLLMEMKKDLFKSEQRFDRKENSEFDKYPLLKSLFELEFIEEIVVRNNEMRLKKNTTFPWKEIAPRIAEVIRKIDSLGEIRLPKKQEPKAIVKEDNHELPKELDGINEVLAQNILPALAQHGGSVKVAGFKNGVLEVVFSGGCQGCSQSTVTVKQGIEKLLKQRYPQINEVRDITQHTEGTNPYYT
jgi:Fe-S cluster biogenesis protein NfuA